MATLIRLTVLSVAFSLSTASPLLEHDSFGHSGSNSAYGNEGIHHAAGFHDALHKSLDNGHSGYSANEKDAAYYAASKASDVASHKSGAHDEGAGNKYSDVSSDFGKDVKSKSFGFFDYKYVQPQYHVEQYHSDEKHASKYGSDAHAEGAKHHADGGFHNTGYEGYGKKHDADESHHGEYGSGDVAHAYKNIGYNGGWGDNAAGHYNRDYNGYGGNYGARYSAPQFYGYGGPAYSHGRSVHDYGVPVYGYQQPYY